jgi:NADH-quinone oxidoreductase subunit A
MNTLSPWEPGLFSLLTYCILVVGFIGFILFLTVVLGVKKETPEKTMPYESGVRPTGMARFSYPVPFYLVATFFLIFDVEAVFIFTWAVAAEQLGWLGWLQITVFILVLMVSLFYIWMKGGLEWGSSLLKK